MLSRLRTWLDARAISAGEPARPSWVDELLEALQKHSRSGVKHTARLEAALTEQGGRIEALARQLERALELSVTDRARELAPLFDALDALDEAARLSADPHSSQGLALVAERVQGFCAQRGFERPQLLGRSPDPRVSRVVGTETHRDAPAGAVARVVRAAVLHGERVVREGEVIVAVESNQEEVPREHLGN